MGNSSNLRETVTLDSAAIKNTIQSSRTRNLMQPRLKHLYFGRRDSSPVVWYPVRINAAPLLQLCIKHCFQTPISAPLLLQFKMLFRLNMRMDPGQRFCRRPTSESKGIAARAKKPDGIVNKKSTIRLTQRCEITVLGDRQDRVRSRTRVPQFSYVVDDFGPKLFWQKA
ncbi:hypothetical protein [Rhizobium sp. BT-226]|uniref:hypothetical protein n=1 Tax=Rhizobium sp. BT-226 TaxID=2986922 RepID=UPI0021F7A4E7|nr:hypothetical protein [Rhizobium sp. BT-226]MCW0021386.1 hypothetical protein [Rhizobium sp. BT-226]